MIDVWIGLGGNQGEVSATFRAALSRLALNGLRQLHCSSIYRTRPVGPQDQPDFLNAVCHAQCRLSAEELLALLLDTETTFGRERHRHWGERTLDLDLLLYGDQQIHTDTLQVPHPRMHERAFVLEPLAELDGALIVPGTGTSVSALLEQCNRDGVWYHGHLSG